MTLINRFPSQRVKVDGNVWRFSNASVIARDALSLSPLNFDMVVTEYCVIIVSSGPRPVGRPCLVSLPLLLFSLLVPHLRVVGAFIFTGTICTPLTLLFSAVAQLVEHSLRSRKVTGSIPCRPCCFILAVCSVLVLTLLT